MLIKEKSVHQKPPYFIVMTLKCPMLRGSRFFMFTVNKSSILIPYAATQGSL